MKKTYGSRLKQLLYVLLLGYGVWFMTIWSTLPWTWWRIFLLTPIIIWGLWTWDKFEKQTPLVSVRVHKQKNEDGEETLTIDVDNATPEDAKEIYDHIKELNL